MAEIDQPRFLNDEISMSSSAVNIETGLLSPTGLGLATASVERSPTPTGGWSEVGKFDEQNWGDLSERGHPGIRLITRRAEMRQSEVAKISGMVAVGALVALAVTTAVQLWTFEWGSYTETFEGQRGIVKLSGPLQGLASLTFAASVIILGIGAARRRLMPSWMVVVLAVGATTTFYLTPPFILPGLAWLTFGLWLLIAPSAGVAQRRPT